MTLMYPLLAGSLQLSFLPERHSQTAGCLLTQTADPGHHHNQMCSQEPVPLHPIETDDINVTVYKEQS